MELSHPGDKNPPRRIARVGHPARGNIPPFGGVCRSMDFNRLQSLIAAPLASLFVILCLCWFGAQRPREPVGINVPTLKMRRHSVGYGCEDDRWVVVWLRGGGKLQINETPMEREQLAPTIRLIFENRVSRVAYLMADPGVNVAEAAWALDSIGSATSGMHVVLMTPNFKKLAELPVPVHIVPNPGPYIPPCDWEWAENGYEAPSPSSSRKGSQIA